MKYTTYIQTEDGKIYDLGKGEYRPSHDHKKGGVCPKCNVINAWTAPQVDVPVAQSDRASDS